MPTRHGLIVDRLTEPHPRGGFADASAGSSLGGRDSRDRSLALPVLLETLGYTLHDNGATGLSTFWKKSWRQISISSTSQTGSVGLAWLGWASTPCVVRADRVTDPTAEGTCADETGPDGLTNSGAGLFGE